MEYTTTISSEEYKKLILKAIEYNNLKEENEKLKKEIEEKPKNNIFEKIYFDNLYGNQDSYIQHLEIKNGKCDMDKYFYQQIRIQMLQDGVNDLNYIDKTINELKERYDKENKEKKENK